MEPAEKLLVTEPHLGGSLEELETSIRALRPPLLLALAEDARMFRYHRGEALPPADRTRKWLDAVRLLFESEDYAAVVLYRVRTALAARSVPLLPRLLHLASVAFFHVRIGDFTVLGDGIYVPHGNIVVDGITVIGRHVVLAPWTTIGVVQGSPIGPTLEDDVFVGTGAKVLGQITIGAKARIGANSVVVSDVAASATAIGAPAREVGGGNSAEPSQVAWPGAEPKV
jgi:serine acetyltransferase